MQIPLIVTPGTLLGRHRDLLRRRWARRLRQRQERPTTPATAVLIGLVLHSAIGLWWADA